MKKRLLLGSIIVIALASGIIVRPDASVRADDDARIVTVHLDGDTRTIATNATTVAGVIKRLGTTLSEHDKTEPALSETVRGADFTVNVYRARPITVTDGANNYTVVTAERSPAAIAKDAGFETKQEDDFIYRRNDEVYAGAPGTQMIILRSKNITLSLYGKKTELNTRAETVQDFLNEREIELETGDEVNVPLTRAITEGMTISIDAVQRDTKTVEEDVPFEEEQIKDAQQPVGYREVKEAGVKGRKLVTYEIVIKNNGKPQRIVKKEVITKKPVKQVVIVGAKGISGSNAELLKALRTCETGGNYTTNTGNGFYGAYQFMPATWRAMNTGYDMPHIAPPAVQDDAALRLAQRSGFHSQFPGCSQKLGLPPFPN